MTDQLALPLARTDDPHTSKRAARKAAERAPGRREQIIAALQVRAMTDDEICDVIGEHPRCWPSIKTARSRLVHREGIVEATGRERNGQQEWRVLSIANVPVRGGRL